jgi:nicotinamide mononucleotide adenylyltransferase
MKGFLQFLQEASAAATQATKLGLVGDGHGGWYDKGTGEFVAKTEKGQLKFYNKRQAVGKDPAQTEKEKTIASPGYNDPALTQQQTTQQQAPAPEQQAAQQPPEQQVGPPPVPKTKGTLTIAFGRFNPPTIGHQQLMDVAAQSASSDEGDYLIYPSRSQDKKKNPLDPDTKVSYMRRMFPTHSERIVNDSNTRTIFDVLKKAHNDGYTNVRIVGGADRVKEFEKLSNNYNGQLYQFDNIEVVSAGERDPDAKGIEGMSASRMRLAAAEGDFKKFREGLPPDFKRSDALELFDNIRGSMNIKEGWNIWEIAPKFDWLNLRENYITEKIYQIGQLVENLNTGLVGRIIRRGTNYLICVTEDHIMFKSWIKDVMEAKYTEKTMNSIERVPGKPNTLVGTLGYFKYASSKTPGAIGKNENNLQHGAKAYGIEFINKYRKK